MVAWLLDWQIEQRRKSAIVIRQYFMERLPQTDKRYSRDNRLMVLQSSYRRDRLAPRCLLNVSWSWKWFQGFGCSPIKTLRELGLERCKTVRSLSVVNIMKLKRVIPSTRGPELTNLWFVFYFFNKYENKLSLFLIITEIKLSKKQSFKFFIFSNKFRSN